MSIDEEKAQNCRTCEKIFIKTGTLSRHVNIHGEKKVLTSDLHEFWEIIHRDWDLEQTLDFT